MTQARQRCRSKRVMIAACERGLVGLRACNTTKLRERPKASTTNGAPKGARAGCVTTPGTVTTSRIRAARNGQSAAKSYRPHGPRTQFND